MADASAVGYDRLMIRVTLLLSILICLSACACSPDARPLIAGEHGPDVQGLALQLEIVDLPPGRHFRETTFDAPFSDEGGLIEIRWPKLFRLTLHNVDDRPKIVTLGLNVNGEPSIDDDMYVVARNLETGEVTETDAGAMSYWGSFERAYLPLPAGARYSMLLRCGRAFVNDTSDKTEPTVYEVWAEYRAGFVVYPDNRGRRELVSRIVSSNRLRLTRRTNPPSTVHVFEQDHDDRTTMDERWSRFAPFRSTSEAEQ